MHRLILTALIGLTTLLFAGPALAFQCPKLVTQINTATAQRFDAAAANAKAKGVEANNLHAAGKHAEAEKVAKEALASLGIQS